MRDLGHCRTGTPPTREGRSPSAQGSRIELEHVAREDAEWTERWVKDTREDEDRRRERGEFHRVESYRRDDVTIVHAPLAKNPRRR